MKEPRLMTIGIGMLLMRDRGDEMEILTLIQV